MGECAAPIIPGEGKIDGKNRGSRMAPDRKGRDGAPTPSVIGGWSEGRFGTRIAVRNKSLQAVISIVKL
jgi:hypothetical protein